MHEFLNLDDLWTLHNLEQIALTAKNKIPLPKDIEIEMLQNIKILLLTVSLDANLATHGYLQPLDGHEYIYSFDQCEQQSEVVTYYIGKYGACPVAISKVQSDNAVCDSVNAISIKIDHLFPNLCAIISVGVICGIKEVVKICDVLVSSEVINCDKTNNSKISSGDVIAVSPWLLKMFNCPVEWPSDVIKKRLNNSGMETPKLQSGIILSGSCLDNIAMKELVKNCTQKVIGFEKEGDNRFAVKQVTVNTIIVKGVCDFGDGENKEKYQPTAALLAADLVYRCLGDPQAHETLKGIYIYTCS